LTYFSSFFAPIFILNLHEKGIDLLPLIQLCLCYGLSVLLGFDEKDSFQKELKEEYRSNEAPREQTEVDVSMHNHAQGSTAVLQVPKGRTAVPLAMRLYTGGRAGWHGRAPVHDCPCSRAWPCAAGFRRYVVGFRCFGGSFWLVSWERLN